MKTIDLRTFNSISVSENKTIYEVIPIHGGQPVENSINDRNDHQKKDGVSISVYEGGIAHYSTIKAAQRAAFICY